MPIQQNAVAALIIPGRTDNTPMPQKQHQCSWCGKLLGGPLDGLFPATPEGLVAILAGDYIVFDQCDQCIEDYSVVDL